ncbi:MAG: hypothetical protein Q9174_001887 [Haloplaca sp. 1 TL-2023]
MTSLTPNHSFRNADIRIHKRPLLRNSIPSLYASSAWPKVLYISTHTPFIPAIKRVRKLLDQIKKRETGKVSLNNSDGIQHVGSTNAAKRDKQSPRTLGETMAKGKASEEVILKATSRAIERALGMAVFWQGQEGLRVVVRTGSQGVVDDIEEVNGTKKKKNGRRIGCDEVTENEGEEKGEKVPETRIRRVSVLEVGISWV